MFTAAGTQLTFWRRRVARHGASERPDHSWRQAITLSVSNAKLTIHNSQNSTLRPQHIDDSRDEWQTRNAMIFDKGQLQQFNAGDDSVYSIASHSNHGIHGATLDNSKQRVDE